MMMAPAAVHVAVPVDPPEELVLVLWVLVLWVREGWGRELAPADGRVLVAA